MRPIGFMFLVVVVAGCGRTVTTNNSKDAGPTIKEIRLAASKEPFTVRGRCELSTRFLHTGYSRADFYLVEISQKEPADSVLMYVGRETEEGRKLFEILGKGASKEMTVECQFFKNADSYGELRKVIRYD